MADSAGESKGSRACRCLDSVGSCRGLPLAKSDKPLLLLSQLKTMVGATIEGLVGDVNWQ